MAQFPKQTKLSLFLFKTQSDLNGMEIFKAETSASSSVSSRLPVILLRKVSHIPPSNIPDSYNFIWKAVDRQKKYPFWI